MVDVNDAYAGFKFLRGLAYRLDMYVGVENRKLILAGNERITLGTDQRNWALWLHDVSERMSFSVNAQTRAQIMSQLFVPPDFNFEN